MSRIFLTKEQAISTLPIEKEVHTFTNPGGMLVGMDYPKDAIIEKINNSGDEDLEIGGKNCKNLKHALIIHLSNFNLFVESNMNRIEEIENEYLNKNFNFTS